jgi:hypothetical protein
MKSTKQGATYYKYSILLICFIIGALLFRGCKCGGEKVKEPPIVRIDTFWKKQDTFISYVPQPYKVLVPYKVKGETIYKDSVSLIEVVPTDTAEMLTDYRSIRYYKDSFQVKYGKVFSYDTVRNNRIIGKGIATSFNIPVVTKTYTIEAQKRNVVLFGVSLIGNKASPLFGTEFTLDLKNKNDRVYEVGGLLLKGGDLYYKAGIRWPIYLHKK